MECHSLGHRAPLLWIFTPFLGGLAAGRLFEGLPALPLLAVALLGIVGAALALSRGSDRFWALGISIALAATGCAAYPHARSRDRALEGLPPREVRLDLRVIRVFSGTNPRQCSGLAVIVGGSELEGRRIAFAIALPPESPAPARSSVLHVRGILSRLPAPPPGSFESYLEASGVDFRLQRGRLLEVRRPASSYRRFCERVATRFSSSLGLGIEESHPGYAAVQRAMLLGWQQELSSEQKENYLLSGTMHLFSVSGLHVTVIYAIVRALLRALRFQRHAIAASTVLLVGFYVDLTGASPPAIRAFLLVLFLQCARVLQQPSNGIAALAAAACAVALLDPLAPFGASFQMSYGVVFAILTLGLPLGERLKFAMIPSRSVPDVQPHWLQVGWDWCKRHLAGGIGMGAAATLVGFLTGLTYFQLLTPAGFLANLLVIPISSLALCAGSASILAGLLGIDSWSVMFNHAAVVLLFVMEGVVRLGAALPGGSWQAEWRHEWLGPASLVLLLASMAFGYACNWRKETGGFLFPFVVTAICVFLGIMA